ncbi:caspase family protein [Paraburkholderia sacchari]|uniref:Caspase family protein n=1 Tax=Paraburkholderia sacchari TaxID=159450 RepID=A0A8T6ZBI4_9BURK|nr:caspase family protein [Paraburkholderia sacchari]NLP60969.1 caspase family protein [Paraburkholderia sacchari]
MLKNGLSWRVFHSQKRATLGKLSALAALPWLNVLRAHAALAAAPRMALVVGNAAYPQAPLNNPGNDARALAAALRSLGFTVDMRLDSSRQQMDDAIGAFCDRAASAQWAALFYFAGHGIQIDWRNYLLPVDMRLTRADDVARQAVDLGTLLDGLGKAHSSTNIVILDACRDNPFGSTGKTGAGLSQMDAPPRTLLAYATAPGNVASDGDGKNGLYTENLLKEIGRPDTRIEDVFKRVRLSVRQRSDGRQIPWESTSLEDDFYFVAPVDMHKPTQSELDAQFAKDRDDWNEALQQRTAQAIFAYLKAHPNGQYSEIAQAALDRTLAERGEERVRIQTSPENPYSHGSFDAGVMRIGDRFTYRVINRLNGHERALTQTVTRIAGGMVEFNHGAFMTDLLGNLLRSVEGAHYDDNQVFPHDYAVGKEWSTRFGVVQPDGTHDAVSFDCKVVSRDAIEVPAGRYDAFHVELSGWRLYHPAQRMRRYWMAPDKVPRFVAIETIDRAHHGRITRDERRELLSFVPG